MVDSAHHDITVSLDESGDKKGKYKGTCHCERSETISSFEVILSEVEVNQFHGSTPLTMI